MVATATMGLIPIPSENPDGCVCIHREVGKDGHCINRSHPVCEKFYPGPKRTLVLVFRRIPAHA
jgi:hypothetical protein